MIEGLYGGDCRELSKQIPDESVDLIFTDPPYLQRYLYLYDWLAMEAERVLKPGGRVMCYAGHYHLDYVFGAFAKTDLNYFFTMNSINLGPGSIIWKRNIISRAKSIPLFTKGDFKPRYRLLSAYTGRKDKKYHIWGQSADEARYYVDGLSEPGEIVYDPFAGGGTTPWVCERLGRKWIAFEIEQENCEIIEKRLKMPVQIEAFDMSYEQYEIQ